MCCRSARRPLSDARPCAGARPGGQRQLSDGQIRPPTLVQGPSRLAACRRTADGRLHPPPSPVPCLVQRVAVPKRNRGRPTPASPPPRQRGLEVFLLASCNAPGIAPRSASAMRPLKRVDVFFEGHVRSSSGVNQAPVALRCQSAS
jgi:hypothetical protein